MYSYEARIRAVNRYIKLCKRTGPTIRQFGYPTKNALKSWYREYETDRDLRVVSARTGQKYSDAQKLAAVQHYLEHVPCIASTITALGIPCRDYLSVWISELHPELRQHMMGRGPNVQHRLEQKTAAVIELCTRTTSAQEIAKKVAVCRPTLYNWKNQLLGRRVEPISRTPYCSNRRSPKCPNRTHQNSRIRRSFVSK
jgi:putative transposase